MARVIFTTKNTIKMCKFYIELMGVFHGFGFKAIGISRHLRFKFIV